ncbi:hypothetical protein PybrP1_012347 [[Pythium] brassicae (nom. inval.)]|nr:hypothetical protein PybrP1_012347 [[Pythium] brassicae (nom. inval.)]
MASGRRDKGDVVSRQRHRGHGTDLVKQEPTQHDDLESWFDLLLDRVPPPCLDSLTEPVRADEIAAAIKSLGRGTACGPDRLGNDHYKDLDSDITAHLLELYSAILTHRRTPTSFSKAEVYCIPKVPKPAIGLDCRPFALLNGDYKLLARLLATRLRRFLHLMVHEAQSGFVPGQKIHDTLDILSTARELALANLVVILLDSRKAYDSIDQAFIRRALLWLGFTQAAVYVIMYLHVETTAAFLAKRVHIGRSTHAQRHQARLLPRSFTVRVGPVSTVPDDTSAGSGAGRALQ